MVPGQNRNLNDRKRDTPEDAARLLGRLMFVGNIYLNSARIGSTKRIPAAIAEHDTKLTTHASSSVQLRLRSLRAGTDSNRAKSKRMITTRLHGLLEGVALLMLSPELGLWTFRSRPSGFNVSCRKATVGSNINILLFAGFNSRDMAIALRICLLRAGCLVN